MCLTTSYAESFSDSGPFGGSPECQVAYSHNFDKRSSKLVLWSLPSRFAWGVIFRNALVAPTQAVHCQ